MTSESNQTNGLPGGTVVAELSRLLEAYVASCRQLTGELPRTDYEPEWPSPCQVGMPDADDTIAWRPVVRAADGRAADGRAADGPAGDGRAAFDGIEGALEIELHPAVKTFYGTYWAESIPVVAAEGSAKLIQVWSPEDHDRLLENLIGHLVAQRKARLRPTVFFACTDGDELMLSVDNASGAVVLEAPGGDPLRELAPSLAEFLHRLEAGPGPP